MTAKHSIRFHSAQPEKIAALWGKEKGLLWQEERNDNLSAEFHRRAETYNIIRKAAGPTFSGKFTSSPANLLAFLLGFYFVCTLNRPEGGSPGFFSASSPQPKRKINSQIAHARKQLQLNKKIPPNRAQNLFFLFLFCSLPPFGKNQKTFLLSSSSFSTLRWIFPFLSFLLTDFSLQSARRLASSSHSKRKNLPHFELLIF